MLDSLNLSNGLLSQSALHYSLTLCSWDWAANGSLPLIYVGFSAVYDWEEHVIYPVAQGILMSLSGSVGVAPSTHK